MKKTFLPVAALCLAIAFFTAVKAKTIKPASFATNSIAVTAPVKEEKEETAAAKAEAVAMNLYDSLKLEKIGLTKEAMLYAYLGHQNLVKKGQVNNSDILTICDFSQSSSKKRMYIVDVKNFKVLMNTYVAHGKNSGLTHAKSFSNVHESLQSSMGFYVTKQTYTGKHGLSLRLDGKDRGFNDNAESRAVVVHGADYIGEHRLGSAYMGRSFGCPAVPQAQSAKVINLIKDGTTLFIYYPSQKYLNGSNVLNG
jgi:hypothetical protein